MEKICVPVKKGAIRRGWRYAGAGELYCIRSQLINQAFELL